MSATHKQILDGLERLATDPVDIKGIRLLKDQLGTSDFLSTVGQCTLLDILQNNIAAEQEIERWDNS